MIWFLIACSAATNSHGDTLSTCLPMQPMAGQQQCEFVAQQYRSLTPSNSLNTRCIGLRRNPA